MAEGDTEAFEELVQSGVNGIILTAGNPKDRSPLSMMPNKPHPRRGINGRSGEPGRSCIVCVEPRLNGNIAGELMGKFVPPGSKVAVIAGMLTTEDHRKKTDAFSEPYSRSTARGGK